jgi:hypothetical protein
MPHGSRLVTADPPNPAKGGLLSLARVQNGPGIERFQARFSLVALPLDHSLYRTRFRERRFWFRQFTVMRCAET